MIKTNADINGHINPSAAKSFSYQFEGDFSEHSIESTLYQAAMFILNESLIIDLFSLKLLFVLFYFILIILTDFLLVKAINWKEVRIKFVQIIGQSNIS